MLYHVTVVSCSSSVLTVLNLSLSWGHGDLCSDLWPRTQHVPAAAAAAAGDPWAGESSSAPVLRRLRLNREKRDSRLRASTLIINQADWQQLPEEMRSSYLTAVTYWRWVCRANCTYLIVWLWFPEHHCVRRLENLIQDCSAFEMLTIKCPLISIDKI